MSTGVSLNKSGRSEFNLLGHLINDGIRRNTNKLKFQSTRTYFGKA